MLMSKWSEYIVVPVSRLLQNQATKTSIKQML
jgi:hypothetical protein